MMSNGDSLMSDADKKFENRECGAIPSENLCILIIDADFRTPYVVGASIVDCSMYHYGPPTSTRHCGIWIAEGVFRGFLLVRRGQKNTSKVFLALLYSLEVPLLDRKGRN